MHDSRNHTMDATSHSTIVNPSTLFHDRTRPLSNNSGHCLETHTGYHLEDEETGSPANTVIPHYTLANSSAVFHDRTRPLSTNSGHCLENDAGSQLEDADTATSSIMVRDSNTQNLFRIIKPYRRGYIYRPKMDRLLQL